LLARLKPCPCYRALSIAAVAGLAGGEQAADKGHRETGRDLSRG
jgi:hypothetical protein